MENKHNQRKSVPNQKQVREEELDIAKGARETDQLHKMKENAKPHSSEDQQKQGTPASVKVNDGSKS